jgi:hypothetical protein
VRVPAFKTDPRALDIGGEDSRLAIIERNVDGDPSKARITFQPDIQIQESTYIMNFHFGKKNFGQIFILCIVTTKSDALVKSSQKKLRKEK